MKLPKNFKQTIANTFYDKTISVYQSQETTDDVGWSRKAETSVVTSTFKGNVNFSKLDKVQESYGITEQIDMTITTDANIQNDSIIGYLGTQYKVIRAIPFDSHNLLIAQKWSSKSKTSISA